MSWSIDITGERQEIKKAVLADPYLPASVKALVAETIHDHVPDHSKLNNGVRVTGYGHYNSGDESSLGNIGKLEVVPLQLVI